MSVCTVDKSKVEISQKSLALSEYMNFMKMSKWDFIKVLKILCLSGVQKKYVCARRGFRVRAPFPPIDMSKTFLGSFSCLLAGWISLQFFSIHFFFLILSTTNFYNFLTISVFNHDFSHLLLNVNSKSKSHVYFKTSGFELKHKYFFIQIFEYIINYNCDSNLNSEN